MPGRLRRRGGGLGGGQTGGVGGLTGGRRGGGGQPNGEPAAGVRCSSSGSASQGYGRRG